MSTAFPFTTLEWQDDGRYQTTCPKGHTSITILQEQKFELLFDIGAYAIVDGYYREAVSSFTSSLERFYEFVIKSILLDAQMSENLIKETWNSVSSQSERQFGAFLFLYLNNFNRVHRRYLARSLLNFAMKLFTKARSLHAKKRSGTVRKFLIL